jgi:hypothetical protein
MATELTGDDGRDCLETCEDDRCTNEDPTILWRCVPCGSTFCEYDQQYHSAIQKLYKDHKADLLNAVLVGLSRLSIIQTKRKVFFMSKSIWTSSADYQAS